MTLNPGPQAEVQLRQYVDEALPLLTRAGLLPGAGRSRRWTGGRRNFKVKLPAA